MLNSAYEQWYASKKGSNFEKFYQIQQLISKCDYTNALILNQQITTTILPEINQKKVNEIVCNHYLRLQSIPKH
jgi:hypothetical protein